MEHKGKLELTWVGKYDDKVIEPRILMEDREKSYGDPRSKNMLIHGDNLVALQALRRIFAALLNVFTLTLRITLEVHLNIMMITWNIVYGLA